MTQMINYHEQFLLNLLTNLRCFYMTITEEKIKEGLSFVLEPDLKKDIISANLVSNIQIKDKKVSFRLKLNNPAMHNRKRMVEACEHYLKLKVADDLEIDVDVVALGSDADREPDQRKVLNQVKKVIAIASGKGGVGKSTITANLAAGLTKRGYKVGIIDADIYGPSMPLMFDVAMEKPVVSEVEGKRYMMPVESPWGVKIMSIGFFTEGDQAVVWRGPMASKALEQMFTDVFWGELDYMLIDLPPGTGDVHLTLVKQAPLDGAIVVSTPQEIALADARKGVAMFNLDSIKVPVMGLVENMSWFVPEDMPEKKYFIFGKEGAVRLAEELKVPLLGQIPLVQSIREAGDVGRPAVMQGDTIQAKALQAFADQVIETVEK